MLTGFKEKYMIDSRTSAGVVSVKEFEKAVLYDSQIVDNWLSLFRQNHSEPLVFSGKKSLKAGLGANLGISLYLLARDGVRYNAIDIHKLAGSGPEIFFESGPIAIQEGLLAEKADLNHRFECACKNGFNFETAITKSSIDLVFPQTTFNNFNFIEAVIMLLGGTVKAGTRLVSRVDLELCSREIREKDPTHIIYGCDEKTNFVLGFQGFPTRLRLLDYEMTLRKYGWCNLVVLPLLPLPETALEKISAFLAPGIKRREDQQQTLSCIICAIKADQNMLAK